MLEPAVVVDEISKLEEKRAGLYRVLRALRKANGPRRRIRAVVLELDELDSRLDKLAPEPAPALEEEPVALRVAPPPQPAPKPPTIDVGQREKARSRLRIAGFVAAAVFPL